MGTGPVDEAARLAGFVAAQGSDRGPAAGPASHPDDGSVSASAIGAGTGRRHGEAGLVLEDDPAVTCRSEPFTWGHTSFFHSSTACSSRSSALRAGACQDQPCRFSSRQTVATDRLSLRRERITA